MRTWIMMPSQEKRTRSVGVTLKEPMRAERHVTVKKAPRRPTSFHLSRSDALAASLGVSSSCPSSASSASSARVASPTLSASSSFPSSAAAAATVVVVAAAVGVAGSDAATVGVAGSDAAGDATIVAHGTPCCRRGKRPERESKPLIVNSKEIKDLLKGKEPPI